jgi:hypothetical protein
MRVPSLRTRHVSSCGIHGNHWIGGTPTEYLSTASVRVDCSSSYVSNQRTYTAEYQLSLASVTYPKNPHNSKFITSFFMVRSYKSHAQPPKGGPPLVSCLHLLIQYITVTLHIGPPMWSSGQKFLAAHQEVLRSIPGANRFSE